MQKLKTFCTSIYSSWITAILLAIFVSLAMVVWVGTASYHVDGFTLGLSVAPAISGETELAIPPFGEVKAYTHATPVRLRVAFERVIPSEIQHVAGTIKDSDQLVNKIQQEGMQALKYFVLRLIILAGIGGMIGAALSPGYRRYKAIAGLLVGVALMGSILGLTYRSYDIRAFKQPRYSGMLTAAPWATEEIAKRLADIKAFRKELLDLVKNIDTFYSKIDSWHPIKGDSIIVLHVSDIHNNPLAIDIIKRVVKDFNVDVIVDTGDITDLGIPIESTLIGGIAELPVPYIYVPGNHDSASSLNYIKQDKNVTVLDSTAITVKGLRIFGIADPNAHSITTEVATPTTLNELRSRLEAAVKTQIPKPMIVAVHNPKAIGKTTKMVPLILTGHTHRPGDTMTDGCVVDNAGSSGGAGVRSITTAKDVPYTFKLIHIDNKTHRIIAIDSLELTGTEQEFRLERKLIEGKSATRDE